MKTVKLFGDLQAFKADWELEVTTPGEALRAIDANRPGFLQAADAGDYIVLLVDKDNTELIRQVTIELSSAPWDNEILWVIPRVGGEVPAAAIVIAWGAVGVTTTVGSFLVAATAFIINIGLSLAISAIANVITGNKKSVRAGETEHYESKPSFISNGPVNVVRAGHPYPIIAGRFLCGSIVLSSQVHVKDIPL